MACFEHGTKKQSIFSCISDCGGILWSELCSFAFGCLIALAQWYRRGRHQILLMANWTSMLILQPIGNAWFVKLMTTLWVAGRANLVPCFKAFATDGTRTTCRRGEIDFVGMGIVSAFVRLRFGLSGRNRFGNPMMHQQALFNFVQTILAFHSCFSSVCIEDNDTRHEKIV